MHPDITISGDVVLCAGLFNSEYRLFGMHPHGEKVCGKAWHHEDRFDPGDMSKCYVRLQLVEGALHMEVRMLDGNPDDNDPDLQATLPVEGGSADACDADNPAPVQDVGNRMNEWSEWTTYVFTKQV
jgi:hypothetical protein